MLHLYSGEGLNEMQKILGSYNRNRRSFRFFWDLHLRWKILSLHSPLGVGGLEGAKQVRCVTLNCVDHRWILHPGILDRGVGGWVEIGQVSGPLLGEDTGVGRRPQPLYRVSRGSLSPVLTKPPLSPYNMTFSCLPWLRCLWSFLPYPFSSFR